MDAVGSTAKMSTPETGTNLPSPRLRLTKNNEQPTLKDLSCLGKGYKSMDPTNLVTIAMRCSGMTYSKVKAV